jgi:nicotinamidase-related amidase
VSEQRNGRGSWWDLLTAEEQVVYGRAGYGHDLEWGDRPALLIVDTTYAFTGHAPVPILEAIKEFPTACGESAWASIAQMEKVLEAFRTFDLPVLYTIGISDRTAVTRGAWRWKKTALGERQDQADANEIPPPIAPRAGDTVIPKTKPSAFFATPLASYLTGLGIDTVIVMGGVTSGCVRATVVDAFSQNYRTIVIPEAVFDRARAPHLANLLDMESKYAALQTVPEVLRHLDAWAARMAGQVNEQILSGSR